MSWLTRLRNSARHGKLAVEIDEELQFHISRRTRDNIAAGMPPDEARQDALRRFGHPPAIRQEIRDVNLIVALKRRCRISSLRHAASERGRGSRRWRC